MADSALPQTQAHIEQGCGVNPLSVCQLQQLHEAAPIIAELLKDCTFVRG